MGGRWEEEEGGGDEERDEGKERDGGEGEFVFLRSS